MGMGHNLGTWVKNTLSGKHGLGGWEAPGEQWRGIVSLSQTGAAQSGPGNHRWPN